MADEDLDWTPADEARDRIDRLDEAKADAKQLKKDLNLAKSAAKTLLKTTKPNTARSYDSDESSYDTVYSKYTHFDYKKEDEFNRENYKKYKKMDKADPQGAIFRKLLAKAGISRAHVENMPREGKLAKFKMGKLSTRLYNQIDSERTYDQYYHWLPPKNETEKIAEEVKELLSPSRLNMLSPKEQALTLIRKTPTKPVDVTLPKRRLKFAEEEHPPPGLAPAQKKHLDSRGNHVFYNYSGDYKKGKMHGIGTYCFADGTVHTGRWVNNKRNGKGISKYKHGHVYDGMWKDNKYHGRGTITMGSGMKYSGDWVEGKRCGDGVIRYPGGQVYDGKWANNKKNGWGTMTNSNGFKFVGTFKDDLVEGPGAFYQPDGKRTTKSWWERTTFSNLINVVKNEKRHKEKQQMEEFREKNKELDAELLEAYVQDVREYNEQLAREKYEMELLEQRRQREERREKMRQAKLDASAAMQKEREEEEGQ